MKKIKLSEVSAMPPKNISRKEIEDLTKDYAKEIAVWHEKFRAQGDQSLLVVLQGMDSSGKDGSTKAAFARCSPIGIHVVPFKKPTKIEFAHDFLWRVHKQAPAKGAIHVFNRSHYEDVLIHRVHNWIDDERAQFRFKMIDAFEELLQVENNTKIVKLFLHLSKSRQEEKLHERTTERRKFYKHGDGDWQEREHWQKYMSAYEDVLNYDTVAPWTIVPADKRWYRNYIVTKAVVEAFREMNPQFPDLESDLFTQPKDA